ncbi:MAG: 5'/3'-nucleotidase SurE [Opitutales bacterium]|jgi:5'-nucleotidase|nr:5'/3'-nucleotidase SurE [Opitutales bacterium]
MISAPTVLVTNDDGIGAAFFQNLVRSCIKQGFHVWVAAPSGERSWIGRAFSRHREVTVSSYPNCGHEAWSIDGTPSDCVNIALGNLFKKKPDVVLSGMNIGFNATMPLCLSSGTLAGATEGSAWGLPAVACSFDLEKSVFEIVHRNPSVCPSSIQPHLDAACDHAAAFAKSLVGKPVTGLHVHSLNYPSKVTAETKVKKTIPAIVRHNSLFKPSAFGYSFAWSDGDVISAGKDTDLAAIEEGLISHTVFDFGHVSRL